ncbi:MAG TPA: hypothetical protein PKB02_10640 [Anaerohalosphaeraceae bacterium]|nr:hypothetical protein [Anaerohalosphaeraceae bacterium]
MEKFNKQEKGLWSNLAAIERIVFPNRALAEDIDTLSEYRDRQSHLDINDKKQGLLQYLKCLSGIVERLSDYFLRYNLCENPIYVHDNMSAVDIDREIERLGYLLFVAYQLNDEGFAGYRSIRYDSIISAFNTLYRDVLNDYLLSDRRAGKLKETGQIPESEYFRVYGDKASGIEVLRARYFDDLCREFSHLIGRVGFKWNEWDNLRALLIRDTQLLKKRIGPEEPLDAAIKGIFTPIDQGLPAAVETAVPPPAQDTETEVENIDLDLKKFNEGDIKRAIIGMITSNEHNHFAGNKASYLTKNIRKALIRYLGKHRHKGNKIDHETVFSIHNEENYIKLEYKGKYRFNLINIS